MTSTNYANLVSTAASALKERKEEVNRLNVFPVPDGDTGTNMSLTMDVVVAEVAALPAGSDTAAACHAITHGSLMGARGNSGVILSQILRGLCEGIDGAEHADSELLAVALERSVVVAFQAVRKPVEGTILTVLRDASIAARSAADRTARASRSASERCRCRIRFCSPHTRASTGTQGERGRRRRRIRPCDPDRGFRRGGPRRAGHHRRRLFCLSPHPHRRAGGRLGRR